MIKKEYVGLVRVQAETSKGTIKGTTFISIESEKNSRKILESLIKKEYEKMAYSNIVIDDIFERNDEKIKEYSKELTLEFSFKSIEKMIRNTKHNINSALSFLQENLDENNNAVSIMTKTNNHNLLDGFGISLVIPKNLSVVEHNIDGLTELEFDTIYKKINSLLKLSSL